jgi:hypothetical protein
MYEFYKVVGKVLKSIPFCPKIAAAAKVERK